MYFSLNCSYFGCIGAESWSNHIAGRCIELINACVNISTTDRNRNIRSGAHGSLLLAIVEKFGNYAVRNSWLLLWFICKHNGITESHTTSNNIDQCSHHMPISTFADHNGKFHFLFFVWFLFDNDIQWKIFRAQITKVKRID